VALRFRAAIAALVLLSAPALAADLGGIECAARKPPGAREWWSYRIVDGRPCWYAGRASISKSLLRWSVSGVRVAPASNPGEAKPTADVPAADFSGTFIDRWNLLPLIYFDPRQMKDWK